MKQYRVKPEFIDKWGSDYEWALDPVVSEDDIRDMANGWGMAVDELMDQVEEIGTDAAAEIIDAGLYDAAVALMDDELREQVHADLAPCSELEFLARYMELHREKYGVDFVV